MEQKKHAKNAACPTFLAWIYQKSDFIKKYPQNTQKNSEKNLDFIFFWIENYHPPTFPHPTPQLEM